MAVIQREFRSGEFHVANDAPFQDDNISWEAKGVLGYLFSKPDDWTPRIYDIVQAGACEKYKIKRIFKELEEYGYLEREKIRDDEGQFDWKVTVWDHPRQRPGWTAPAPDSAQHGQNGGASNTDSQSDGQTVNTESETPAREEGSPPCTVEEAITKGEEVMVAEDLCREWWHYYNSKGWPNEVRNLGSALKRWKINDIRFNGYDEENEEVEYNDRGYSVE